MTRDFRILAEGVDGRAMLREALRYARLGWAIHPCVPKDKLPILTDWPNVATSDRAVIERWWQERPLANIGLCPARCGLVVIDVDPRHGGDDTWWELRQGQPEDWEATVVDQTGGGGNHYYYLTNGYAVANGNLGSGVEVKALANVIIPPSIHPSGNGYDWVPGSDPWTRPIASLPQSLASLMPKPQEPKDLDSGGGEPILQGERNITLTSIAGALRRKGLGEAAIDAALQIHNAEWCKPPMEEKEVTAIARSIGRYAPQARSGVFWSLDRLLTTDFPEPKWVIPGLIPAGLTILGGRPKQGKSLFALNLAIAVAMGRPFLGRDIEQGAALYIALEDTAKRMAARAAVMGATVGEHPLTLTFEWAPLNSEEGFWELEEWIRDGLRLVAVDTVSRAMGGSVDWDDVAWVTRHLAPLQRLALEQECGLVLVDHHRKPTAVEANLVDDLMGSTGKAATADTILGLYRKRGERGAKLAVTGRDIDETELAIVLDSARLLWGLTGEAMPMVQTEILETLARLTAAGTRELARALGRDPGNVYRECAELEAKGMIAKRGSGKDAPWMLLVR